MIDFIVIKEYSDRTVEDKLKFPLIIVIKFLLQCIESFKNDNLKLANVRM